MIKKIILLIIGVCCLMFNMSFAESLETLNVSPKAEKVYVVGYDNSQKEKIFKGMSENEISAFLYEKVTLLRKNDQDNKSVYQLEKQLALQGLFVITSSKNEMIGDSDVFENSTREIGDVIYTGSVTYMVELHFMDMGWQAGEYSSYVRGTTNSQNNYAQILNVSTRPTKRMPYVHINGGYYGTNIYGNKAVIHFLAKDMTGPSTNSINLLLTSNGQLFVD